MKFGGKGVKSLEVFRNLTEPGGEEPEKNASRQRAQVRKKPSSGGKEWLSPGSSPREEKNGEKNHYALKRAGINFTLKRLPAPTNKKKEGGALSQKKKGERASVAYLQN